MQLPYILGGKSSLQQKLKAESVSWGEGALLTRCLSLGNLPSFDPQKLQFVNSRQMQKLFISSSRVRKKEVEKSRYIHGQFVVYCDFQSEAGGSEQQRAPVVVLTLNESIH